MLFYECIPKWYFVLGLEREYVSFVNASYEWLIIFHFKSVVLVCSWCYFPVFSTQLLSFLTT